MQTETLHNTSNGSGAHVARLATNRLAPQQQAHTSAPAKGAGKMADDVTQNRLAAKKLAEDKARARTLARAQAVAEKVDHGADTTGMVRGLDLDDQTRCAHWRSPRPWPHRACAGSPPRDRRWRATPSSMPRPPD